MLTGIIKATRAHYAALQHRPSADRVPLDYSVTAHASTCDSVMTAGTIWVKANAGSFNSNRRQAELTKLTNRLRAMYPEAHRIVCAYRHE